MQILTNTNIERIIAKIDNDFNPDNSDWIPRVGAWVYDAMSMLDVLKTTIVKKELIVKDRIAISPCNIKNINLKVFDKNGCEIKEAGTEKCKCGENNSPSTGEVVGTGTSNTTVIVVNEQANEPIITMAEEINSNDLPARYNVKHIETNIIKNRNYIIVGNNKIELNFNTDCIIIQYEGLETYKSKVYKCELPVIPNNGLLIESIAYYCIYKMLCRGYKHPVFNLHASQYGTNPYYIWNDLKDKAKRSIIINGFDEDSSKLFRSNLFINTFDPR